MKLYQTIDGTLIGFYRERGGEVQALMYRDVYETVMVEKSEMVFTFGKPNLKLEQIWREGHWVQRVFTIPEHEEYQPVIIEEHWEYKTWTEPAHWGTREYWLEPYVEIRYREVPGHTETQWVWSEEYSVTRYREVPGHYETQNIWVPGYYVTRYYWREASPARGLEAAWIPYQHWIEDGYKDQRVWVDTYTEEYEEIIPAGEKESRVWVETYQESYEFEVPGAWQDRRVWFPEVTRTTKTWVPMHEEVILVTVPETTESRRVWEAGRVIEVWVDYGTKDSWEKRTWFEPEQVWVGYEPVYEYVDESKVRLFEVLELLPGAAPGPDYEDVITIRNMATGEELRTTATYLGLATRVADNEFVVPP